MLHRFDRNETRGFTLMELVIVLGVVGTVLGAIWWAAGNARELARVNSAVTELQTVAQNMITLYGGRTITAAGDCTSNPKEITCHMVPTGAGVIPGTYVNISDATKADNPWSASSFKIYVITNRTFRLSFYNVSRKGCLSLLSSATACEFGQVGCPTGAMTNISINAIAPANIAAGWPSTMTSTEADTLCAANSYTGGNNSVEFDYSL